MIPEMPSPDDILKEMEEKSTFEMDLGTGFLFDFDKGEFVIENGRLVEKNGIDAVKMWITKILKTEKYQFEIYDIYPDTPEYQYGTLTEFTIGKAFTEEIKSQIQENIEMSAMRHPRVNRLDEWKFEKEDDLLTVYFRVNLVDDLSFAMEVNL